MHTNDRRKIFNEDGRRKRRDIARDVWAAYRAVAQAAGFLPIEIRTAEAVSLCHYEVTGQDYDKPRAIKLALIGGKLSSRGDSDKTKVNTASNRTSSFFTNAQPRTGYQLLTRYKAVEENRAHEYVDHVMPVAEVVAEYWATQRRLILSDSQPQKQARIADALERLAGEALGLLPACEAELVDENGEVYAYLSDAEARTHSAKNPNLKVQAKTTRPKRPLCREDFDRIEEKIRNWIADELEDALARNSFDEARYFAARLKESIPKSIMGWVKAAGAPDCRGENERDRELIYVPNFGGQDTPETPVDSLEVAPQSLGGKQGLSGNDCNTENLDSDFQVAGFPRGQVNFDTALEAAEFYVRDGWAIVPCCQFDPATGRCTGPEKHHEDEVCTGKTPLIKGRNPVSGAGFTAASRDKGLIADWFNRQFPDAGVALRLDGHILIDADVKNGGRGIESYQELADTFDLPATLTAITTSGGRHFIFKLPEGLDAGYLGNWTRVLDIVDLPDIDIKTGVGGLAHVEPTAGKTGIYRWVDPTAEITELPRAVCDFIHDAHELATLPKSQPQTPGNVATSATFDPNEDQAKYFRDAPNGERRPRLRSIACCIARGGASVNQIVDVLKFHDSRFTEPTNDFRFMAHVAEGAVTKFGLGVAL